MRPLRFALAVALLQPAAALAADCGSSYTVRAGDTLHAIAQECDTSVPALMELNPAVAPRAMAIGTTLRLVSASPSPDDGAGDVQARTGGGVHVVEQGDTMATIAARSGLALADLIAANADIDDPSLIRVGQRLRLPDERDSGDAGDSDDTGSSEEARPRVRVATDRPAPGGAVRVVARGLPAGEIVKVSLVSAGGGPTRFARVRTSASGELETRVRLPDDAVVGSVWKARVSTQGGAIATSSSFGVSRTSSGGGGGAGPATMTVTGRLTDEGVECQALRGDDGRLYTLTGGDRGHSDGTRVRVGGRVADMSSCQQGTTIQVTSMERLDDADRDDGEAGTMTVTGRLTDEGVECQALRGDDGRLYTLVGDVGGFANGTRVRVTATRQAISFCMQGTTISVRSIEKTGLQPGGS